MIKDFCFLSLWDARIENGFGSLLEAGGGGVAVRFEKHLNELNWDKFS